MDLIKREFLIEVTNSPYWKRKKVVQLVSTESTYKLNLYKEKLFIKIKLTGNEVTFVIANSDNKIIPTSKLKYITNLIKVEREFKRWNTADKKIYDVIRNDYFSKILNFK